MKKLNEPIKLIYLPKRYKGKAITLASTTDGQDAIVSWDGRKWVIDIQIDYSSFSNLPTITDKEMEKLGIKILDHVYISDMQHVNRLKSTIEEMKKNSIEIISDELLDLYESTKRAESEMLYRLNINTQIFKLRNEERAADTLKIYDDADKAVIEKIKTRRKK